MFKETEEGLFISPKEALVMNLLDEIDEGLKAKGITFDELISSGRQIRQEIYDEKYAADADGQDINGLKFTYGFLFHD